MLAAAESVLTLFAVRVAGCVPEVSTPPAIVACVVVALPDADALLVLEPAAVAEDSEPDAEAELEAEDKVESKVVGVGRRLVLSTCRGKICGRGGKVSDRRQDIKRKVRSENEWWRG